MEETLEKSFITPEKGGKLSNEFGMFSMKANAAVKAALKQYFKYAPILACREGLDTPGKRLRAFRIQASSLPRASRFMSSSERGSKGTK